MEVRWQLMLLKDEAWYSSLINMNGWVVHAPQTTQSSVFYTQTISCNTEFQHETETGRDWKNAAFK